MSEVEIYTDQVIRHNYTDAYPNCTAFKELCEVSGGYVVVGWLALACLTTIIVKLCREGEPGGREYVAMV